MRRFPAMRVTGGRGKWGKMERMSRRTFWWSGMGRGLLGGGSPATYRGSGHGSSAPASSGEVGKGLLDLGASYFREESIQGLGWSRGMVDGGCPRSSGGGRPWWWRL